MCNTPWGRWVVGKKFKEHKKSHEVAYYGGVLGERIENKTQGRVWIRFLFAGRCEPICGSTEYSQNLKQSEKVQRRERSCGIRPWLRSPTVIWSSSAYLLKSKLSSFLPLSPLQSRPKSSGRERCILIPWLQDGARVYISVNSVHHGVSRFLLASFATYGNHRCTLRLVLRES